MPHTLNLHTSTANAKWLLYNEEKITTEPSYLFTDCTWAIYYDNNINPLLSASYKDATENAVHFMSTNFKFSKRFNIFSKNIFSTTIVCYLHE